MSGFERHWSALDGRISKLPGQPTDEFLEIAKTAIRASLDQMNKDPLSAQKKKPGGSGAPGGNERGGEGS